MAVWREETGENVAEPVWEFVNRLSDYCFVLARFVAKNLEIEVYLWEK
jgi:cob(I)alamin adenosyltransferase